MRFQTFSLPEQSTYPIAFLAPKLHQGDMEREYLDPIALDPIDVVAYELHKTGKKTSMTVMKEYLDSLLPVLSNLQTQYVIVGDGDYFKALTGLTKAEPYLGYVVPNTYPASMAGQFNVIFAPNYRQTFYNPGPVRAKIQQALDALWDHRKGVYREPGCNIIHFSAYPSTTADIAAWLQKLIEMRKPLTCDIEAFSLKHYDAGIGTISFAWSETEGISFPVDLSENPAAVRKLLLKFFKDFKETMTYHHISYDVTVLIYQLFMKDILDTEGLLTGLEIMLRDWDDTKLIAYLATNTCAGNELGLKAQAQEYAGNYAVENIKDITKISLPRLLEYNLVDTLSTWFVRRKHWDQMVADDQLDIYETLFKPAIVDIIQMQLTGMPVDMEEVKKAAVLIENDRSDALRRIHDNKLVQEFTYQLNEEWVAKRNDELKVKRVSMADAVEEYNPNSPPQTQRLIYELMGLPVMARTATKLPSCKADDIAKLKAHTENQDHKDLINALLDFASVDKIYGTFLPPMLDAPIGPDGWNWLFGSFNLGGTVSGRLSSSGPNLQNLPAKGRYAKIIKGCFRAPPGWVMIGLDFDSLEDKISAVTTKDTNKLKVYLDNYDGHCLRAFSYYGERMPDIENTLESINSIASKYPQFRQDSKTPTFLLTYGGTHIGLVAKCDLALEQAKEIESRYHELYIESDEWVAARLDEASKVGYITGAFGLRVRTPLLKQVIRGNRATPYEAESEGRTAGNALGQSWCLLNSRASVEFLLKVRASKHRLAIRPIAHIHDAQYFLIRDDLDVLQYVNKHLVKAVEWQDHPDIAHDQVKLSGAVDIFFPSWANPISIPNGAGTDEIQDLVADNLNPKSKEKEAA